MTPLLLSLVLATSFVPDRTGPEVSAPQCHGLFALIQAGDVEGVRAGLTPETVDAPGTGRCSKRTPLLAAAQWGQADLVELLLGLGADVNFTVVEREGALKGRVTAECLARAFGHDAVGALLRKRGAQDTRDGCLKRAALFAAVSREDPVRLAKERKAGNRLPVAQLLDAVRGVDCGAAPAYCTELVRHLPKEPSDTRDEALDELEAWVEVVPALRQQLSAVRRAGDGRPR
ncbi:MAG: hypothetical protein SFW67_35950 [Myxococcaceae bacterium]|nr:hypothetical protein [Myxococcaceae bacterium]